MAVIKIHTKSRGIGLGNQVWFIPVIKHLIQNNHFVWSDSLLYDVLEVCATKNRIKPDLTLVPMWPDWWEHIKIRSRHPFSQIEGFTFRVKGRHYSLFNRSVVVDQDVSELELIRKLIPNEMPFKLENPYPTRKKSMYERRVICGTSSKEKCYYLHWDKLERALKSEGFDVVRLGELGHWYPLDYVFKEICQAKYYIGVDNGLMHLADILNKKGVVIWGETTKKNRPLNMPVIEGLNSDPKQVLKSL